MKDDMETSCMNELFGRSEYMIAQIYVKTSEDDTSMVVSNEEGDIYFQDVLDVPEITAIQRCASFVKHNLKVDGTEIYPDKLGPEILNDVFINYCRVNHKMGDNPNPKTQKACENNLITYLRWKMPNNGRGQR